MVTTRYATTKPKTRPTRNELRIQKGKRRKETFDRESRADAFSEQILQHSAFGKGSLTRVNPEGPRDTYSEGQLAANSKGLTYEELKKILEGIKGVSGDDLITPDNVERVLEYRRRHTFYPRPTLNVDNILEGKDGGIIHLAGESRHVLIVPKVPRLVDRARLIAAFLQRSENRYNENQPIVVIHDKPTGNRFYNRLRSLLSMGRQRIAPIFRKRREN